MQKTISSADCETEDNSRFKARLRRRSVIYFTAGVSLLLVLSLIAGAPSVISSVSGAQVETTSVGCALFDEALNPSTNLIYATDYNCNKLYVINGSTNTAITSVTVGSNPEGVAVNPETNLIYVANSGNGTVSVINGATNAVIDTIQLGRGVSGPGNVAVNPTTDQIFVTYYDTFVVINGTNNTIIRSIIDYGNPYEIAVNQRTTMIYVSNFDNDSLSTINGSTDEIVNTLKLGVSYGASGVAFNPSTGMIYVIGLGGSLPPTMGLSSWLWVVSSKNNRLVASVQLENDPLFVALDSLSNTVYISTDNSTIVSVNATTNYIVQNITETPYHWNGIDVNSATGRVYVVFGLADGSSQGHPSGLAWITSGIEKTTASTSFSLTQQNNNTSSTSMRTNPEQNMTTGMSSTSSLPGTSFPTDSLIASIAVASVVTVGIASYVLKRSR